MPRPTKNGLDYFPVDTDIFNDEKIQHVSAAFGLKAEAIAIRLLCKIYRNGGYLKWTEDEEKLFSAPLGRMIKKGSLHDIIQEFLNRDFFNKKLFEDHRILTSNGIQKRYISICKQLHRNISIPASFLVSSEETHSRPVVNSEKSTQIKENKIKENKREINKEPAPHFSEETTTAEQPLFFASLKNIFINFYEKNFSARPTFSKGEEKTFGELVEKLLARMTATKTPTLEENAVQLFIYFLERAFEDEWLADHFLLSNLVKQFDSILDMGRKRGAGKKQVVHIPLEELFERYQRGDNVFQRITEEHYHEVNKTKYLKITTEVQAKAVTIRRKELQGSNRQQDIDLFHAYEKYPDENPGLDWDSEAYFPLCKRVAVMFYFAQTTTKSL